MNLEDIGPKMHNIQHKVKSDEKGFEVVLSNFFSPPPPPAAGGPPDAPVMGTLPPWILKKQLDAGFAF